MTLTITDITESGGAPRVEVLLTGLDAGVASVTAYRFSRGIEEPVSGVINAPVAGAGNWIDYEVPAQAATYKVELFDAAGSRWGLLSPHRSSWGTPACGCIRRLLLPGPFG